MEVEVSRQSRRSSCPLKTRYRTLVRAWRCQSKSSSGFWYDWERRCCYLRHVLHGRKEIGQLDGETMSRRTLVSARTAHGNASRVLTVRRSSSRASSWTKIQFESKNICQTWRDGRPAYKGDIIDRHMNRHKRNKGSHSLLKIYNRQLRQLPPDLAVFIHLGRGNIDLA